MNLLALRYFLEVSRHLNFSRASEKLHISQPGLSQQIIALEKELGFKLFNRTTRKVTLTEEGQFLYRSLLPLFEKIEDTVTEITEKKAVPKMTIKIATISSAASIYLPKLLTFLHRELPDIQFYLQETTTSQAIELLKQQKSHFAFIRTPIEATNLTRKHGFSMMEFANHPIQLVVSKHHPLARRDTVDLYELRNENFIHYDRHHSPSLYYLLERACLTAGFVPSTLCAGPELLTISNLIAHGLGVTLMPTDMISLLDPSKVAAISLKDQHLQSSVSVIWRDSDYVPLNTQIILRFLKKLEYLVPNQSFSHCDY